MHGLWQRSRGLSTILIIAILCITGAPLFSIKSTIYAGQNHLFIRFLFVLINLGTMMSFIKFLEMIFTQNKNDSKSARHINRHLIKEEWRSLQLLAFASATLGLFSHFITPILVNYTFEYTLLDWILKWPAYLINYAIAYFIYKIFFVENRTLRLIRKFDITFNETNIVIISFFFIVMLWIDYL